MLELSSKIDDFIINLGSIAGLAGIALGIFFLLFRNIQLPRGTRKHLTLFMWMVWSITIVSVATYLLLPHNTNPIINKEWSGEIFLNESGGLGDLPVFLYNNNHNKVDISIYINLKNIHGDSFQIPNLGILEELENDNNFSRIHIKVLEIMHLKISNKDKEIQSSLKNIAKKTSISIPINIDQDEKTGLSFIRFKFDKNNTRAIDFDSKSLASIFIHGRFHVSIVSRPNNILVYELIES